MAPDDPREPSALRDLWQRAEVVERLFLKTGDPAALDAAIVQWEQTLALVDAESSEKRLRATLTHLGGACLRRYQAQGNPEDLVRSLEVWETAADTTTTPTASLLSNLGVAQHLFYERTGDLADLRRSIDTFERALRSASEGDPVLPVVRDHLSKSLRSLYESTGDLTILRRAIDLAEQGLELSLSHSPGYPTQLTGLGLALLAWYDQTGDRKDLETAVQALGEASRMTSPEAPDAAVRWSNVGLALGRRYTHLGDLQDLSAAASCFEEAIRKAPRGSPIRPSVWTNLGIATADLYARTQDSEQLETAILCFASAVDEAPPEHPQTHLYLGNLALGLSRRHDWSKSSEDLDTATDLFRKALGFTSQGSPSMPMLLSNLAACLVRQPGGAQALDEPIRLLREALARAPEGMPVRPQCLHNLASCLRQRGDANASDEDVAEARAAYRQAVIEGLEECPERALSSAREWGDWGSQQARWSEAAEAYGYARKAMARLLESQLLRPARGAWLREGQALAAREAFARTRIGDLTGAVLALEQGSARLLAEALDRDVSRLAALRSRHPDLANRYEQLSAELFRLEAESGFADGRPPNTDRFTRRRQHRSDLGAVLAEIRRIEGYESFLSVPSWEEIQAAWLLSAEEDATALVYLATSPKGSVALIVSEKGLDSFDPGFAVTDLAPLLEETRDGQPVGGYLPGIALEGEEARRWLDASLSRMLPLLGR